MAEKAENDIQYEIAIKLYKKAADYFSMENSNSKSFEQQCLLKAADIMCITDHPNAYQESVKVITNSIIDLRESWFTVP